MLPQDNFKEIPKEEIIKFFFDTVYKLALSQTKNKADAEDISQEVFLKYIKQTKSFESMEHIKAWLIRVTINRCHSYFSSNHRKKTVELTEEIPFDTPEKGEVYYAVSELAPKYRVVIHLFYYEDMAISEISRCLGRNESTVKSQLKRGREMLKNKLKRDYDYV